MFWCECSFFIPLWYVFNQSQPSTLWLVNNLKWSGFLHSIDIPEMYWIHQRFCDWSKVLINQNWNIVQHLSFFESNWIIAKQFRSYAIFFYLDNIISPLLYMISLICIWHYEWNGFSWSYIVLQNCFVRPMALTPQKLDAEWAVLM